jgi:hypothetical protein
MKEKTKCVNTCPDGGLKVSFGLDAGSGELLKYRTDS